MKLEEMREKKRQWRLSDVEIAERSGLSVSAVWKVMSGVTKRPRPETLQALEKAFVERWEGHAGKRRKRNADGTLQN